MFGVGFFELIIIGIVALVVVGPKRLPEVMRQAGRLFVHVRRTANDVRSTFDQVIREAENEMRQEEATSIRQALKPVVDATNEARALLSDQASPRIGVLDHPGVEPPPASVIESPVAMASSTALPEGIHAYTPGKSLDEAAHAAYEQQLTAAAAASPEPTAPPALTQPDKTPAPADPNPAPPPTTPTAKS